MSTTSDDNNEMINSSEDDVLDVLHGGVGCQGLGNLLSCFWTEVVVVKTAKRKEKMHRLANWKSIFINYLG